MEMPGSEDQISSAYKCVINTVKVDADARKKQTHPATAVNTPVMGQNLVPPSPRNMCYRSRRGAITNTTMHPGLTILPNSKMISYKLRALLISLSAPNEPLRHAILSEKMKKAILFGAASARPGNLVRNIGHKRNVATFDLEEVNDGSQQEAFDHISDRVVIVSGGTLNPLGHHHGWLHVFLDPPKWNAGQPGEMSSDAFSSFVGHHVTVIGTIEEATDRIIFRLCKYTFRNRVIKQLAALERARLTGASCFLHLDDAVFWALDTYINRDETKYEPKHNRWVEDTTQTTRRRRQQTTPIPKGLRVMKKELTEEKAWSNGKHRDGKSHRAKVTQKPKKGVRRARSFDSTLGYPGEGPEMFLSQRNLCEKVKKKIPCKVSKHYVVEHRGNTNTPPLTGAPRRQAEKARQVALCNNPYTCNHPEHYHWEAPKEQTRTEKKQQQNRLIQESLLVYSESKQPIVRPLPHDREAKTPSDPRPVHSGRGVAKGSSDIDPFNAPGTPPDEDSDAPESRPPSPPTPAAIEIELQPPAEHKYPGAPDGDDHGGGGDEPPPPPPPERDVAPPEPPLEGPQLPGEPLFHLEGLEVEYAYVGPLRIITNHAVQPLYINSREFKSSTSWSVYFKNIRTALSKIATCQWGTHHTGEFRVINNVGWFGKSTSQISAIEKLYDVSYDGGCFLHLKQLLCREAQSRQAYMGAIPSAVVQQAKINPEVQAYYTYNPRMYENTLIWAINELSLGAVSLKAAGGVQ